MKTHEEYFPECCYGREESFEISTICKKENLPFAGNDNARKMMDIPGK